MNIYSTQSSPHTDDDVLFLEETTLMLPSKVILFDDDWHTFEEVISQIIRATKCSNEKAEMHTIEVHTKGRSIVYEGDLSECIKVSSILEVISLRTQVEM